MAQTTEPPQESLEQGVLTLTQTYNELSQLAHSIECDQYALECMYDDVMTIESANDPYLWDDQLAGFWYVKARQIADRYDISLEDGPADTLSERTWEYIKGLIDKLWQAIKNTFNRFIRSIGDFISKYLVGTKGMMKQIQRLRDEIKKADKEGRGANKVQEITIGGGAVLHMGGEIDPTELGEGLEHLEKAIDEMGGDYIKKMGEMITDLNDITTKLKRIDRADIEELRRDIYTLAQWPSMISNEVADFVNKHDDEELPGGLKLKVDRTKFTKEGHPKNMPTLQLLDFHKRVDYKERTPAPVVGRSQGLELLDRLASLVEITERRTHDKKALVDQYEEVVEDGDDIFDDRKTTDKLSESMDEHTVKLVMAMYRFSTPRLLTTLLQHNFKVIRGSVKYITKSVKSYS